MTTSMLPATDNVSKDRSLLAWLLPVLVALGFVLTPLLPAWLTAGKAAWYISRAGGVTAYLLLAGSTIWGLLLSSRLIKDLVPPAIGLAMHNVLSWSALAFTAVHALVLLLDGYFQYTLADLLVPFIGPYEPLWVGLGVISMYLALLVSASFQWRKQIGQRRWRQLHYLSFAAFGLVTAHGWLAGSDPLGLLYLLAGVLVLFLTAYRILSTVRGDR